MAASPKSSKVNRNWLHDHVNDPYVKRAQREGYRARAAFKLQELDDTFRLVQPDSLVVDLGSTPGAWSQYLRRRMEAGQPPRIGSERPPPGEVIALDLLPMDPIPGVRFLQGDFRERDVLRQLEALLAGRRIDLVVSDMAPNLSGIASADAARMQDLVELAVDFAASHLHSRGTLVAKGFHGAGYDPVVRRFRDVFEQVKPFKPKASRDRSAETYLVGLRVKV